MMLSVSRKKMDKLLLLAMNQFMLIPSIGVMELRQNIRQVVVIHLTRLQFGILMRKRVLTMSASRVISVKYVRQAIGTVFMSWMVSIRKTKTVQFLIMRTIME